MHLPHHVQSRPVRQLSQVLYRSKLRDDMQGARLALSTGIRSSPTGLFLCCSLSSAEATSLTSLPFHLSATLLSLKFTFLLSYKPLSKIPEEEPLEEKSVSFQEGLFIPSLGYAPQITRVDFVPNPQKIWSPFQRKMCHDYLYKNRLLLEQYVTYK
jgi:hypothetical protein